MGLAPKAGDECLSCAEFWDEQRKPRQTLVIVATTQNHHLLVPICPYCDGKRLVELTKLKGNE